MSIKIGTLLNGYCNGFFGRDSYGEKRVEATGADWVVVREENGEPNCAFFKSVGDRDYYINLWLEEDKEEAEDYKELNFEDQNEDVYEAISEQVAEELHLLKKILLEEDGEC